MNNFNEFLYGENYPIVKWKEDNYINFWIKQEKEYYACPECGWESHDIHDVHSRKIQDTPIHNKKVFININVREFKCHNKDCKIKTFTEELPFARKNQVRTNALTEFILIHAIYMSSNSTSLILSLLGIDVSVDTIDNILKKVVIEDDPDVEMIGIDDVSIRKGLSYATAIYNLETHHLIALLEGREKEDIIPWLKAHPKIIVVARDRASSYAEAIDEVLPNAVQVADRFHLFENLMKYLKESFYLEIPDKIVIKNNEILDKKATKVLKEFVNIDEYILNDLNYTNEVPVDENGNIINYINCEYNINDKMYINQAKNRQVKYEKVIKIRNDKKLSIEDLSKKYQCCKNSIKKYLNMTEDEVEQINKKKNYNTKETEFSKYVNIAFKMLNDNQPYEYIIAYILKCGYKKSILDLKGKLWKLAKNNGFDKIKLSVYNKYEYAKDEIVITRLELFKYILTINANKINNNTIKEHLELIETKFPKVKEIRTIFKDFHNIIFSKDD